MPDTLHTFTQYFTHEHNIFRLGGPTGEPTAKCWVSHLLSEDYEMIESLDQSRNYHTVHHEAQAVKAYVIGGKSRFNYIKLCLVFDVLNQKFDEIGSLV